MKICPKCGKTYEDPSLNFCLDDGSILNQSNTGNIPAQTVLINEPRPTNYDQPFGGPTQQNQFVPVQNTAGKKGSKAWAWVLGILGLVVLVCGGGFGGLLLIGSLADKDEPKWNSNFVTNSSPSNSTKTNSSSNSSETDVTKIDLSKWVQTNSSYGKTEYRGDEFFANAIKSDFYYVLVASITYKSANATTKVIVRDAESGNNKLGYGLIINSNPIPLIRDYAFLINAKTGKYRVVKHTPGKEQVVVNWKNSSAIKSGTEANILEVKDENGQLKFFINGDLVETVDGKDGYPSGVPGIYVGGSSPISFSNMEIRK
jgi:flagellar basal body-associated protein FliL